MSKHIHIHLNRQVPALLQKKVKDASGNLAEVRARIGVLETRLDHMTLQAPLREKVKVGEELKRLYALEKQLDVKDAQPDYQGKPVFKTYYKVAEIMHSGKFYAVIGQNAASKDDVSHLLLLVDGNKRWFPIKELHATL
jgi:hypothetical protein